MHNSIRRLAIKFLRAYAHVRGFRISNTCFARLPCSQFLKQWNIVRSSSKSLVTGVFLLLLILIMHGTNSTFTSFIPSFTDVRMYGPSYALAALFTWVLTLDQDGCPFVLPPCPAAFHIRKKRSQAPRSESLPAPRSKFFEFSSPTGPPFTHSR